MAFRHRFHVTQSPELSLQQPNILLGPKHYWERFLQSRPNPFVLARWRVVMMGPWDRTVLLVAIAKLAKQRVQEEQMLQVPEMILKNNSPKQR